MNPSKSSLNIPESYNSFFENLSSHNTANFCPRSQTTSGRLTGISFSTLGRSLPCRYDDFFAASNANSRMHSPSLSHLPMLQSPFSEALDQQDVKNTPPTPELSVMVDSDTSSPLETDDMSAESAIPPAFSQDLLISPSDGSDVLSLIDTNKPSAARDEPPKFPHAPFDLFLHTLDPTQETTAGYRQKIYKDPRKLYAILDAIRSDPDGCDKLDSWLLPHAITVVIKSVSREMDTVVKILRGTITQFTPQFFESWSLKSAIAVPSETVTPTLLKILRSAACTEKARKDNKKKESETACFCIIGQLGSRRSQLSSVFSAPMSLFFWRTGCSRLTIKMLSAVGLCKSYTATLQLVDQLGDKSVLPWAYPKLKLLWLDNQVEFRYEGAQMIVPVHIMIDVVVGNSRSGINIHIVFPMEYKTDIELRMGTEIQKGMETHGTGSSPSNWHSVE
ncbi:hypothetical protein EDD85DRAFT_966989 [Armillaria nabsnona]|nr:hypothetical protein EDD85DRAFT_966989 [Armillaria nabsnona]